MIVMRFARARRDEVVMLEAMQRGSAERGGMFEEDVSVCDFVGGGGGEHVTVGEALVLVMAGGVHVDGDVGEGREQGCGEGAEEG